MTREEILPMTAGREMDALVARRVMGWREGVMGVNAGFWVDADGKEMAWNIGCGAWSPSTQIEEAWQVVERLGEQRGLRLVLEDWRGDRSLGVEEGWCALLTLRDGHDTGQEIAPTAPLAICRIALLACL